MDPLFDAAKVMGQPRAAVKKLLGNADAPTVKGVEVFIDYKHGQAWQIRADYPHAKSQETEVRQRLKLASQGPIMLGGHEYRLDCDDDSGSSSTGEFYLFDQAGREENKRENERLSEEADKKASQWVHGTWFCRYDPGLSELVQGGFHVEINKTTVHFAGRSVNGAYGTIRSVKPSAWFQEDYFGTHIKVDAVEVVTDPASNEWIAKFRLSRIRGNPANFETAASDGSWTLLGSCGRAE